MTHTAGILAYPAPYNLATMVPQDLSSPTLLVDASARLRVMSPVGPLQFWITQDRIQVATLGTDTAQTGHLVLATAQENLAPSGVYLLDTWAPVGAIRRPASLDDSSIEALIASVCAAFRTALDPRGQILITVCQALIGIVLQDYGAGARRYRISGHASQLGSPLSAVPFPHRPAVTIHPSNAGPNPVRHCVLVGIDVVGLLSPYVSIGASTFMPMRGHIDPIMPPKEPNLWNPRPSYADFVASVVALGADVGIDVPAVLAANDVAMPDIGAVSPKT